MRSLNNSSMVECNVKTSMTRAGVINRNKQFLVFFPFPLFLFISATVKLFYLLLVFSKIKFINYLLFCYQDLFIHLYSFSEYGIFCYVAFDFKIINVNIFLEKNMFLSNFTSGMSILDKYCAT
jgi:hypothetical protein